MQVILHIGAHCTDEDRLLKCLLRNVGKWRQEGVAVPGPSKYRKVLSEALNNLGPHNMPEDARDIMMDMILAEDPEQVERLLLSHQNIFGVPKMLLGVGTFYRHAEKRIQLLRALFHPDQLEVFLAIRNPATFLPAVFATTPIDNFQSFLNGVDPMHLRWSELIERLQRGAPDVPITVWCNEDTPIIWGEVVREMAGIDMNRKIIGAFEVMGSIISREGMQRFRGFLKEHPGINEMQKRRVMTAFLDKYALDDEVEEELDLPGWNEEYVDALTEIYDEDVYKIASMPGVDLITP